MESGGETACDAIRGEGAELQREEGHLRPLEEYQNIISSWNLLSTSYRDMKSF